MNVSRKHKSVPDVKKLTVAAVFMALNIAMSSLGIPVPGGHLYLCDLVICTAAILLDPFYAFAVGGIGSFLGDLIFYPLPMFVSLVVHGVQAVIISLCVRYTFKDRPLAGMILGVALGGVFMVAGYTFGKAFIYSTPEYAIVKLPYEFAQAIIGAVGSVVLCRRMKIDRQLKLY